MPQRRMRFAAAGPGLDGPPSPRRGAPVAKRCVMPASDVPLALDLDLPRQLQREPSLRERERKYLVDRRTALGFWAAVSAQPRLHAPHGKVPIYVRTTYFDTTDFAYYRGTAGPVSRRIRVREYAAAGPD